MIPHVAHITHDSNCEQLGHFLSKYNKRDTHIQYTPAQLRTSGANMTNITKYKIPSRSDIAHDNTMEQLAQYLSK